MRKTPLSLSASNDPPGATVPDSVFLAIFGRALAKLDRVGYLGARSGHVVNPSPVRQSAEYNLGLCYEDGEGVDLDLEKARRWYARAAAKGYEKAASALAELDAQAS